VIVDFLIQSIWEQSIYLARAEALCGNIMAQMIWVVASRQEMGFLEVENCAAVLDALLEDPDDDEES